MDENAPTLSQMTNRHPQTIFFAHISGLQTKMLSVRNNTCLTCHLIAYDQSSLTRQMLNMPFSFIPPFYGFRVCALHQSIWHFLSTIGPLVDICHYRLSLGSFFLHPHIKLFTRIRVGVCVCFHVNNQPSTNPAMVCLPKSTQTSSYSVPNCLSATCFV